MSSGARAFALAALLAAACSHAGRPRSSDEQAQPPRPDRREIGFASYYARGLQGSLTASGERYDRRQLTCAHRSHPFGTLLRVTDLETGRSVVVKVTDRGPFTEGRVVDLSWAAARALDMVERGVVRVSVEVAR